MADTPRTQSELLTLYADNTTNDISAQDGRDFIVSTYQPQMWIPGGRLTLTTGVPVTTTDVTGATTIYYTPYLHNGIGLYDGTSWKLYSFSELSLALGTLTADKNYDVFLYDNAGTLTLELTAWTNDTTRATALVLQDGVWCKTGALTRRYLGTIRTTSTTTTEDSGGGTTTNVGGKRFVWNAYNRVPRAMAVIDTTDSWSYTTATIRQARANAGNQVEYVCGLAQDRVRAKVVATAVQLSNTAAHSKAGVGVDSTTAFSGLVRGGFVGAASSVDAAPGGEYAGVPGLGYHRLVWCESGGNAGTCSWLGDNGGDGIQSGLTAEVMA